MFACVWMHGCVDAWDTHTEREREREKIDDKKGQSVERTNLNTAELSLSGWPKNGCRPDILPSRFLSELIPCPNSQLQGQLGFESIAMAVERQSCPCHPLCGS